MENILVLGGGLMGTSVAWKLVDRGVKVTLIEVQGEVYLKGSSYGTERISRSLGPKKDVFSYAHNKTIKEVGKLINFLNEAATKPTHVMEDVYATSPVSYLFHKDDYEKVNAYNFKKQKKDFSRASSYSSFRKFGISTPKNTIMLREKRLHSGTLNPTALLTKLRTGIEQKGGDIKYDAKVISLIKVADYFEVEILHTKTQKTQKLKAKKVVVAAGPYTVQILNDFAPYLKKLITPKKVALSFFKIKDERYKQLTENEKKALHNGFPFFAQIGKEYFSMISKVEKDSSPILKAGGHRMRSNIHDLEKVWTEEPRKKEKKWIKKQFRKHLKMLEIHIAKKDIEEVDSYYCVYSVTRKENPIVSNIFNKHGSLDSNIVVIGGMSGIGAKGCLCYGDLGADLMLGKADKPNKMYRKLLKTLANPSVNLYTKRIKSKRLF